MAAAAVAAGAVPAGGGDDDDDKGEKPPRGGGCRADRNGAGHEPVGPGGDGLVAGRGGERPTASAADDNDDGEDKKTEEKEEKAGNHNIHAEGIANSTTVGNPCRDDRTAEDDATSREGDGENDGSSACSSSSDTAAAGSTLDAEIRELNAEQLVSEWLDAARYDDLAVLRAIYRVCRNDIPSTTTVDTAAATAVMIDWSDPRGNTALHMAAANGHAGIVQWLLDRGAQMSITNEAGNTPLHWAAANGREEIVKIILEHERRKPHAPRRRRTSATESRADPRAGEGEGDNDIDDDHSGIDVLRRNKFGRSILTEGFQSDNAEVIKCLLEHSSASEERLLMTSRAHPAATTTTVSNDDAGITETPNSSSTIHDLILGGGGGGGGDVNDVDDSNSEPPTSVVGIKVREMAMAIDEKQSIVGQDRPEHDRTGLGVWSSSIVAAHWMCRIPLEAGLVQNQGATATAGETTVLELGAGCAVPSLVLAKRLAANAASVPPIAAAAAAEKPLLGRRHAVYASDWNTEAVENIRYNLRLNQLADSGFDDQGCSCHAIRMDWKDPRTWGPWAALYAPLKGDESEEKSPAAAAAKISCRKPSIIIGADLIYETSMVEPLVNVITALLDKENDCSRFYYVAPVAPRQGGLELVRKLLETFRLVNSSLASSELRNNPLRNQDDDECFLHFQELLTTDFRLYEFAWL